jgi:PAS domain S-box-containing protein
VALAIINGPRACEGLSLARHGADATVHGPADATRLVDLAQSVRRQRSLMRVEELLKERSRALRESEGRWRSLFEAIPEIIVVHDDDGVIRHVNQTGADHLGYPAHELIGRNLGEFEPHAAADPNPGSPGDGDPSAGVETVWTARNGAAIPVEVIQRRMRFDGGAAVLSVARDITVRHDLARQRQNFLAMLTHDIKNPLAVVLGFAELLGEVGELNAEQRDMVGRMQANAGTVLGLVANYLKLTQIESGGLALQPRPVGLRDLLAATLVPYLGQATQEGLQLDAALPADLGVIEADPLALERVFTNLLHNAIKFTPAGGRIAVEAERGNAGVTVRVRDTGVGIDAAELATIFQPYRRGTTRQPRQGVGLGLFIAESLVQAHGGRIAVESRRGAGTTFSVWLPAALPVGADSPEICAR